MVSVDGQTPLTWLELILTLPITLTRIQATDDSRHDRNEFSPNQPRPRETGYMRPETPDKEKWTRRDSVTLFQRIRLIPVLSCE